MKWLKDQSYLIVVVKSCLLLLRLVLIVVITVILGLCVAEPDCNSSGDCNALLQAYGRLLF
jgi:hypothetical protein